MKKFLFLQIALWGLGFLPQINAQQQTTSVKVLVWGRYHGRDEEGMPSCDPIRNDIPCIVSKYEVIEGSIFPLGIVSATFTDPGTLIDYPISSAVYTPSLTPPYYATINFTWGVNWVGPFSFPPGTWAIMP